MATRKRAAAAINFAKIAQQMNISKEFLTDRKVKIINPTGFPYETYNGKACVHPWSVLHMVELCRAASFNKCSHNDRSFLDTDKIYENHFIFMVSTNMKISPKLYDSSLCKGPLELHVELNSVGKTSVSIKTSMFAPEMDTPICENVAQSVCVDQNTRLPSPLPDWWIKKYSDDALGRKSLVVDQHVLPDSGFLTDYQVRICASDLDPYWHTNWTQYVRFGYNAFINHGVHKHGLGNIARGFRQTKEFSVLYLKESTLLDVLDVRMWKEPDNVNLFKFQFSKGSEVTAESQMEFYPHSDD